MQKKLLITLIAALFQNLCFGQIYNMTNTTINTCTGTFFDNGGPASNYTNNANFTMTFCSVTPGQQITFTFTAFQTENLFDYLYIYNGPNTAAPLLGGYTGNTSPGSITSTNGCLTFRFVSDGSTTKSGWTAQIGCGNVAPPPPPNSCGAAQPFCTGTTINFPAGTNNGNAFNNPYNCLGTSPNPAWYYLQIQNPGNLDITMQSSPLVDIDFILWGPFPSIATMCTSYSLSNVVDCSYSPAAIEYANIVGATTGQVYLLLITNYSNTTCNISFTQTGGAATTNCNILCNMTTLSANPTVCNPLNNTYSVSGQVTFQYPPAGGTFTVSSSCGGTPVSIPSTVALASPYSYTINNIPATGAACTITASFSADPTCNKTQTYTSPPSCSCGLLTTTSNTPASCTGANDGTASVNVSNATGTPTYSWSAPGGNTNSISGLTAGNYTCQIIDPGIPNCTTTVVVTVGIAADAIAPSIVACPANITLNSDPGVCGAIATWLAPTTTDNCSATISQTAGLANGALFPIGTNTVSYLAQDLAGNTALCSFTVTVIDTENPIIVNCPNNINISNNTGICGGTATWTSPTVTDNCSANISQTQGLTSGSIFPLGTSTIQYIAADPAGNKDTCTFTVTVSDTENPLFLTCPSNISQANDLGICGAIVNWTLPTFSDNCAGATLTQTQGISNGGTFPLGTTTVVYVVTDAVGLTDTCTFTITITDTENPVIINCPANISQNNQIGQCGAVVTWNAPTTTDNCPNPSIVQTQGLASGSFFPLGTSTISYLATDASGNTDTCTFSITITDNEAPLIVNCPANISQNNDIGVCGAAITWTAPTATDNCPGVNVTQSLGLANGAVFPLGTSTIQYIATDGAGLTDTCTFSITISDAEAPQIVNCPANISQANDLGICGATVTWQVPTVADNCPNSNIVQTSGLTNGAVFSLGTSTIEYIATDGNGNTDTCTFTITITDTESPAIVSCPANMVVSSDSGICGAIVSWTAPTVTDNCPNPTISQISGLTSGSLFPSGTSTIVYVATDANGNSDTCSFTVTVTDSENPVILNCPANLILDNSPGKCGAFVNWIAPTATDNCPGVVVTQVLGQAIGSLFNTGVSIIRYIATDAAGNTDTCTFSITITDTEPPQIANCPQNITQSNDPNQCNAVVAWTLPDVTDNCPGVIWTSTHNPGDVFPLGTTSVTYIATDIQGLTDTCTFTVTVQDTQTPVFTTCPSNMTVSANANCQANAFWQIPNPSDNCPGLVLSSNYNSGATFNLGTTTITYTVTDAVGLADTCSFTVTVQDVTPPLISNCPANILHSVGANCNHTVTWNLPTVTDNCSGVSMTNNNHNSGDSFPFGVTTVTYIATDAAGLMDTCSFTITVVDDTPPVISNCPSNMVFNLAARCDTVVNWTVPSVVDNCPGVTMISNHQPNTTYPLGTTTVTYIATDAAGLKDTCAFTITVNPPPPLNLSITQQTNPSCFGDKGFVTVATTGGSGVYTYTWSSNPLQYTDSVQLAAGNYIVTVKDGLANACVALDTLHIQITQPSPLTLGLSKTNPTCFGFANGTATANVGGGTLPYSYTWNTSPIQNSISATGLPIGTYQVVVNDAKGCTISKSISLTQPDSLSATVNQTNIKCFGDATGKATIVPNKGTPPYQYQWTGSPSTTGTASNLVAGNYTVTITDANTCTINRTFVLTQPSQPLAATIKTSDAFCFGTKTGTASVQATGGTPTYTYVWNTNPPQFGTSVSNLGAGNYTITLKDANNCTLITPLSIAQPPRLAIKIINIKQPFCDSLNGMIEVMASGGTNPYLYEWQVTNPQTSTMIQNIGEGTYQNIVTDANGCQDSVKGTLTNTPPAQAFFTSNPSPTEPIILNLAEIHFENQSQGATSYSWNFGDGFTSYAVNPTHTYLQTGTYTVTLTAYNSYATCPRDYALSYEILPNGTIYIPNAFSPNNDGINDTWEIMGEGIKSVEGAIYNRWGTLIYILRSQSDKWDGREQKEGKEVPEGAYTYKIEVRLNDGSSLKRAGTILIIR